MIDLTAPLQSSIIVEDKEYLINTDFRYWIKFDQILKDKPHLYDLAFLFTDVVPDVDFSKELLAFYINDNPLPRTTQQSSSEKLIDYKFDSEYLISSFYKEYRINLTLDNLHWHLFKALLIGLPDDSKMKKIMGYRSYIRSKKTEDQFMQEMKKVWSLDGVENIEKQKLEEKEEIEEINKLFYNC